MAAASAPHIEGHLKADDEDAIARQLACAVAQRAMGPLKLQGEGRESSKVVCPGTQQHLHGTLHLGNHARVRGRCVQAWATPASPPPNRINCLQTHLVEAALLGVVVWRVVKIVGLQEGAKDR